MPDFSLDTKIHPECSHECLMDTSMEKSVLITPDVSKPVKQEDLQESVVY